MNAKGVTDAEATARIEAALYSAGRPLTIREIMQASGTQSSPRAQRLLDLIMKRARGAFKAIEIVMLPDESFVLQLKPQYSGVIRRYASKPILPKATLKTLSYIAYKQPVSSKDLVETRGTGVYAHLRDLRQLDYISHQKIGRQKLYSTTDSFQKYFGIKGSQDTLKEMLLAKVKKTAQGGGGGAAAPGGAGGGGGTASAAIDAAA